MQVANALNNSIRILFNPKLEAFKLFDFLIVKSDDDKYLAQIIAIYDDKFDSSQNVAKIRLFYKITKNNEVMPYDNFTPNKECEIIKIKQEEIEDFINQDKKTFAFATNVKSSCALNVQYDFFNNNPVILADKIESFCPISINLAKNLSSQKHIIIIDSTGVLEYQDAKKIKASDDFRIPLNYTTLDFIFDRCLKDASLEFQAIAGDILNEIKKFAKRQENEFIPFNAFDKVLIEQYSATPFSELKLLLTRLKRYQVDDMFARSKKDKEGLVKTVEKNPVTIIDLSGLEMFWQKAYLEYIVDELQDEIYLTFRVNDENCDVDLINKIYNKKKNIKFIPNVSYSYKKLPSLIQYCKNYLLLPSLYQRTDFLDANFALSNLISDGCILFGENTDNFIYQAKEYEIEIQEKRKNYRKIALSLVDEEEKTKQNLGEKGDYFEQKQQEKQKVSDSLRLMEELKDFEYEQKNSELQKEVNQNFENEIQDISPETQKQPESKDVFQPIEDLSKQNSNKTTPKEAKDEFQELLSPENKNENLVETNSKIQNESQKQNNEAQKQEQPTVINELPDENNKQNTAQEKVENTPEEPLQFADSAQTSKEETQNVDLSDEELDFFEMAKENNESLIKETENNDSGDSDTLKIEGLNELSDNQEIDLESVANNSMDESFDQIINTKVDENSQTISMDDGAYIDENNLNNMQPKENLPIFKEEIKDKKSSQTYSAGNVIIHKKYGRGTIVKTIKYDERQLLQIEFEESGKKLLDPKVADIRLEQ